MEPIDPTQPMNAEVVLWAKKDGRSTAVTVVTMVDGGEDWC